MRIESAEISSADAAIMMCIRAAESAANPTSGHACLLYAPPVLLQAIFKAMWHPIPNVCLELPMVLGSSHIEVIQTVL